MKKTIPSLILRRRKKEYEKKHITPLLFKFTRPPIMYDDGQIRLRKQIEDSLYVLDQAQLCPTCDGEGTFFEKVEHEQVNWQDETDPREYIEITCEECLGIGLVFPEEYDISL